jgi:hypothetical protein
VLAPAPHGPGAQPQTSTAAPSLPPAAAFPPGPGTGSSQSATTALPSTRHGYPSAAGLSRPDLPYPRYEPPPESSAEMRLKPSRRPYVVGAAVILVVLAVVIAMTIGGSGGNVATEGSARAPSTSPEPELRPAPVEPNGGAPAQPATEGSAAAATAPAEAGSGSADRALEDETISIRVVSDPPGADVLLSGKPIGTTPLDTRMPKGKGSAFLIVRRAKYQEVKTSIDLSGDFSKDVTLERIEDKEDEKKRAEEERKRQEKAAEAKRLEDKRLADARRAEELRRQQEARRQEEARRQAEIRKQQEIKRQQDAAKPKCQDPGRINPFDTNCLGLPTATNATGACPPCAVK